MSEAFRGEFYPKMDSKARVQIPASFKRILEEQDTRTQNMRGDEKRRTRMVIVYGVKSRHYCECYGVAGSQLLEQQINSYPVGSRERNYMEGELITRSVDVDVDDDGRFVLPVQAREKLGLSAEDMKPGGITLAVAGANGSFTLWTQAAYSAVQNERDDFDGLDPKVLLGQAQVHSETAKPEAPHLTGGDDAQAG